MLFQLNLDANLTPVNMEAGVFLPAASRHVNVTGASVERIVKLVSRVHATFTQEYVFQKRTGMGHINQDLHLIYRGQ